MSRKLIPILFVVAILVAVVVWKRSASIATSKDEPATGEEKIADQPAFAGSSIPSAPTQPPSLAPHGTTRLAIQQMEELARNHPAPRPVIADRDPRPGEAPEASAMRTRALADYDRFIQIAHVAPEHDQALRRLIADAEDNWKLALKSANRSEPDATTNIMMDPVLGPVLQTLESDFRRDARSTMTSNEAMMLQSMIPSLLPYIKTKAFVAK